MERMGQELKDAHCDFCNEHLARFNPNRMQKGQPVFGHHFIEPKPGWGLMFDPDAPWEGLKCPVCKFRFMRDPDKISLGDGTHWPVGQKFRLPLGLTPQLAAKIEFDTAYAEYQPIFPRPNGSAPHGQPGPVRKCPHCGQYPKRKKKKR